MQSTIPQKAFKHEVALPVIGQGTWEMEHDDDPAKAIRVGIEHGLTHIDTAEMYGSGRVEAMLGKALRGCRDQTYPVSKVLPSTPPGMAPSRHANGRCDTCVQIIWTSICCTGRVANRWRKRWPHLSSCKRTARFVRGVSATSMSTTWKNY